jgi:hypothetical protein
LIKIPTPEFLVLYNSKDEFPDYKEMKLSDSFELQSEAFFLELVVKVYSLDLPKSSMSSYVSAPQMTAAIVIKRMSSSK